MTVACRTSSGCMPYNTNGALFILSGRYIYIYIYISSDCCAQGKFTYFSMSRSANMVSSSADLRDIASSSTSSLRPLQDASVEQWTCAALKSYLKARGLSHSGLKKAELIEK